MGENAELVKQVERFGLTETEAATYIALIGQGRAKPSKLAAEADISTSYVYEIAERLESEGLAVVKDHRTPTTIVAEPPTESLGSRLEHLEQTLSTVQDRFTSPTIKPGLLETHQSRETVLNRLRERIENAKAEIFLSVPYKTMPEIANELRRAVDRGIFVLLAVIDDRGRISESDLDGLATAVRRTATEKNVYLTTDMGQGLLAPCPMFDWNHGDYEAFSFDHSTIALTVVRAFFGTIWCSSKEVMLRRPPEKRRTYQKVRPAIYHATIEARTGRKASIELRARPIKPNESTGGYPTTLETAGEYENWTVTNFKTRQNLVDPPTSEVPTEHLLVLSTDDGRITVSGPGASRGDYIAEEIRVSSK